MPNYNDVFGGATIPPAEPGYISYILSEDTQFNWPAISDENPLADIVEVVTTLPSLNLVMPPADQVSVGEDLLIRNLGAESFNVLDFTNVAIATIDPGEAIYMYVTDNTSPAGLWNTVFFGVGTSTIDAASLVGYGLKAIGATLNVAHEVFTTASGLTVDDTNRAQLINYTGGADILVLPPVAIVGDDFFVFVRNSGTGTLTINPNLAETIDGVATLDLQPGESVMIFCSGAAWYTVGYGRSVFYNFTQLVKDVSAGGTFVLTPTEAANKLLTFIGNPVTGVTVIVPNVVAVYYILNSLSTAQSVTVKTALGTGVAVPQGQRIIAICDGTNVYSAQSVAASSTVSLVDGSSALPSLNFASHTNTGLYKFSTDGLGITINGVPMMTFSSALGAQILAAQPSSLYNISGPPPAWQEGRVFYDNTDHTLAYYNDASGVTVNIGQEALIRVRNTTGVTLTDGQVVYISGAGGSIPLVSLAKADAPATALAIGVITDAILNGNNGYATVAGLVHNVDTSAWVEGTILYLSATVAGGLTATPPVAPNIVVRVAYVTRQHATQGVIFVKIDDIVTIGDFVPRTGATKSAVIPTGTTAQRDAPAAEGYFRRNSQIPQWEGYTGTAWVGFGQITGPTKSAIIPAGTTGDRDVTPQFGYQHANNTLGRMEWYNGIGWVPMGGGATGGASDAVFNENDKLATANYTIGQGAMTPGATISIASPAVITMQNDFVADQPVRFTTTGALPTGISDIVEYYVIATGLSSSSFQVSTSPGGAAVNTSGVQSGVHSVGKIKNALSAGIVTVASGVTITVPSGSIWSVV